MQEGQQERELFTIYDEHMNEIGTEYRDVVHKKGLYHKCVNVLILNSQNELLIQRRAPTKDHCPDLWDLSVSEHLKPGETFLDAAVRGLQEELSITQAPHLLQRLHTTLLVKNEDPLHDRKDYEFSECWLTIYSGDFSIDDNEVAEAKWISIEDLAQWLQLRPHQFTPWFINEIKEVKLFDLIQHQNVQLLYGIIPAPNKQNTTPLEEINKEKKS